jgi:hypothetical protein
MCITHNFNTITSNTMSRLIGHRVKVSVYKRHIYYMYNSNTNFCTEEHVKLRLRLDYLLRLRFEEGRICLHSSIADIKFRRSELHPPPDLRTLLTSCWLSKTISSSPAWTSICIAGHGLPSPCRMQDDIPDISCPT